MVQGDRQSQDPPLTQRPRGFSRYCEWLREPGNALAACMGVSAVVAGLLIGLRGTSDLWALGLGLAFLIPMFLLSREVVLYVGLAAAYIGGWMAFDLAVIPTQATWLVDIALGVFILRSLLGVRSPRWGRLRIWVVAIVIAIAFSGLLAVASGVPVPVALTGLRYYIRFPLMAMAIIISPLSERFDRRHIWLLLSLAAIQLPVSALQVLSVGAGDSAYGTFAPSGTAIQAVFLASVSVPLMLRGPLTGNPVRLFDVIAGVIVMIPAVLGSVVAMYFLFPLCVLFGILVLLKSSGRAALSLVAIFAVFALLLPSAVQFTSTSGREIDVIRLLASPQAILQYDQGSTEAASTMGRFDQMVVARDAIIAGGLQGVLFGRGPGAATVESTLGMQLDAPLASDPQVRLVSTSFSRVLMELGLITVFVHLGGFVAAMLLAIRAARGYPREPKHIVFSGAFVSVMALQLLLTSIYSNTWLQPGTAMAFWLTVGILGARQVSQGNDRTDDGTDVENRLLQPTA